MQLCFIISSVITIAGGAIVPLAVSALNDLKTKNLIRAVSTLRELEQYVIQPN